MNGARILKRLKFRMRIGLHLPYGPQAAALGMGKPDPPLRR
jgi:hypothetical protein